MWRVPGTGLSPHRTVGQIFGYHGVPVFSRRRDTVQAGEIVVAKLKGGPTLVRCLASPTPDAKGGGRVRVSVGRNREAQLPSSRIVLATGVVASDADELDEFRRRSEGVGVGPRPVGGLGCSPRGGQSPSVSIPSASCCGAPPRMRRRGSPCCSTSSETPSTSSATVRATRLGTRPRSARSRAAGIGKRSGLARSSL